MLFNSIEFVIFLPIVFLLYWFVFKLFGLKSSNILLIISSYVFYGWWNWRVVFLLFSVSAITYLAGLGIEFYSNKNDGRIKLKWFRNGAFLLNLLAIVINLGMLGFFKYYDFFITSFVSFFTIFGKEINLNTLGILLPIGISFYTFQSLSYSVDIYLKKMKPTHDVISYFTFMSFFPPLLSGPIGRASQLIHQFQNKERFEIELFIAGLKQILWGLFMKVCIADRLSLYVDTVYGNLDSHNGTTILFAAIFYSIQIYCDFSGYSLMAIGVAKLFGIKLMDNFVRPYFATSVADFWRRWHISLSTWFRDYVYIPLGGSRISNTRTYFNLLLTFLLSGLWHGAAWSFIFWGGIHGLFQILGKLKIIFFHGINTDSWSRKLIDIVITFFLVTFAWIFFRITDISAAFTVVKKIFTTIGTPYTDFDVFFYGFSSILLLVIREFVDEFYPKKFGLTINRRIWFQYVSYIILTLIIVLFGVFDGSQFIYFQF